MIKYVELTAPEASAYRQAKILSIECSEGDYVKEGDTLFRVQSGSHELNLPSTQAGRVVEIIATAQQSITVSTPLILLETEVADHARRDNNPSDSKQPGGNPAPAAADTSKKKQSKARKKTKKKTAKKHEQQSLDLLGNAAKEVVLNQVIDPDEPITSEHAAGNPSSGGSNAVSPTMSASPTIQITVPDIGADSAKVIDILVKVGDSVSAEDPLITLESDKASMDVPSTHDGVVSSISVLLEQDVSEGTVILELEASEATEAETKAEPEAKPQAEEAPAPAPAANSGSGSSVDVAIPDIGGDSAKVIEILIEVGQQVDVEDPLVTLESDKASMEVPSTAAGVVESIEVSLDQDVSEGTVIVKISSQR